ncbi:hypothetical protein B0H63DRAFT_526343 [Podospora didyma]|uniref:Uncharacterized protein n=1 Tax=Podospora didyma TaxID=330526 RepID=A0AAE0KF44_9PEZI|nr:hypothetical protein B0H63DRAFT_526343 [Podospora didyma]
MASSPTKHEFIPGQLKETFVSQRIKVWQAKKASLGSANTLVTGGWENLSHSASIGSICIDSSGVYVYVSHDDSLEGIPSELRDRVNLLRTWASRPENSEKMKQIESELDSDINKGMAEIVVGGGVADTNQLDFDGKVDMSWLYLGWDCAVGEFFEALVNFCPYSSGIGYSTDALLTQLDRIDQPPDTVLRAQALRARLLSSSHEQGRQVQTESEWAYIMVDSTTSGLGSEDRN